VKRKQKNKKNGGKILLLGRLKESIGLDMRSKEKQQLKNSKTTCFSALSRRALALFQ